MEITIRLFASAREAAGTSVIGLSVAEGTTVRAAAQAATAAYPTLARIVAISRLARNLEYVPDETPIADGDEIVLIPPVSGGSV